MTISCHECFEAPRLISPHHDFAAICSKLLRQQIFEAAAGIYYILLSVTTAD